MRIVDLLLQQKIPEAQSITTGQHVAAAAELMLAASTSALAVLQDDRLVGIFTSWDLIRCHTAFPSRKFDEIPVTHAMSTKPIVAAPDDSVAANIEIMLKARIGHLPVLQGSRVAHIVTLSEMVGPYLSELTAELRDLHGYLDDLQEARED
jgi:CBS domain-containing protein